MLNFEIVLKHSVSVIVPTASQCGMHYGRVPSKGLKWKTKAANNVWISALLLGTKKGFSFAFSEDSRESSVLLMGYV